MSRTAISYRPDVDGLRAVAVTAVLLFHAFPQKLPGGFVGVDIFFVISGYLISGIILKELELGRFTLAGFYARRIRRIFPALALVLSTSLLAGWATLGPDEFRQLSTHTVGGAGFVSNLMFWREAGYFGVAGQSKPLLHLWSLGIEEQFYIGWPILLAVMFHRTRKILLAVAAVGLASFWLNVAIVGHDPEAAFYDPATRVWELLIGAGLARYLPKGATPLQGAAREGVAVLGCLLIAASMTLTTDVSPFPGWWALLPTLGAALLIRAGEHAWVNRYVLASRGFVFVGLISYPLYLWHWPILTYFKLINDSDLDLPYNQARLIRTALLGLACLLAWATWRFWETPIRNAKTLGRRPTVKVLAIAMIAVCVVGVMGATGWMPPRLNGPEEKRIFHAIADWESLPYVNYRNRVFHTSEFRSANPEVALFAGDSHMEQYAMRVKSVVDQNPRGLTAAFATHGNCMPLPGLNSAKPGFDCPAFYRFWTREAAHAKTIVIAAYWENYSVPKYATGPLAKPREPLINSSGAPVQQADIDRAWQEFENTVREWVGQGKRVVLVFSNPAWTTYDPRRALRRLGRSDLALLQPMPQEEFNRWMQPLEERLPGIAARTGAQLIRPADYLCERGVCPALDVHGEPLYMDGDHLRIRTVTQKAVFIDELLRP